MPQRAATVYGSNHHGSVFEYIREAFAQQDVEQLRIAETKARSCIHQII